MGDAGVLEGLHSLLAALPNIEEYLDQEEDSPHPGKRPSRPRKKGGKKKLRKKKRPVWDSTTQDLTKLKAPKSVLKKRAKQAKSKNQEIADVLIEEQKRKHFHRKQEMEYKRLQQEQEKLIRVEKRTSYIAPKPILYYDSNASDEIEDGEQELLPPAPVIKSQRITADDLNFNPGPPRDAKKAFSPKRTPATNGEMLEDILLQLNGFLENDREQKKTTTVFREEVTQVLTKQNERIDALENEVARLRAELAESKTRPKSAIPDLLKVPRVTQERVEDMPRVFQRMMGASKLVLTPTRTPFNPVPRAGPPSQTAPGLPPPHGTGPLPAGFAINSHDTLFPSASQSVLLSPNRRKHGTMGLIGRSLMGEG